MKSSPLVSAIITTHNRADLLPRAIWSVFNQSYPAIELIVVDDGSEDQTPGVIADFQKKHSIHLIRNEKALGSCKARNQGIEHAQGDFIVGLDDDDEWHADRITTLLKEYDDAYACITSNDKLISANRSVVWHKKKIIHLNDLLFSNHVGNQVLAKRERVLSLGGYDESLEAAQDYDLWIRLCEKYGPINTISKPLQNIYRDHEVDRISNPQTQFRGYFEFYKKHKHKMSTQQKKYQLFNIRRAQGKATSLLDLIGWVPPHRLWKELKRWIAHKYILNESH